MIESDLPDLVDTAMDGLVILDQQGIVQAFNPASERIFGYRAAEMIGRSVATLTLQPLDAGNEGFLASDSFTGSQNITGGVREVLGKRQDGSLFPIEIGINAIQLGGANLFIGTIRDIAERQQAETRVSSDAARMQAVMNAMIDGLIFVNQAGLIEVFNLAAARIFGYHPNEVIGRDVDMLMPGADQAGPGTYSPNDLLTGKAKASGFGSGFPGRRRDGSIFPMELGVKETWIAGERMFVATVRDISERLASDRRTEAEAARMLAVMNAVVDGLVIINETGIIESSNPASLRMFGYQAEELIGQNVKMLMPDPYHAGHDSYLTDYLKTGTAKMIGLGREVRAKRKDGSIFPVELGVNEMYLVGQRLFVGTIRDITERKESENAMRDSIEALSRSNHDLDDFAYIASHDLKEPLRGLSNNATFLQEDFDNVLGESGAKRLARITYLCERMERLINDLLYFSRLGRQHLAIQQTDLNAVIADIEQTMETTLEEANASIVIPEQLPVIICDLPRITEVFRNLIVNSVKYNDKPHKRIEIGCTETDGRRVYHVRDNGIGIPREFHQDVFRIFKRLNQEDDQVRGNGVGLTFVKKIVERYGGEIWLESEVGTGTTFYFFINQPQEA